MRAFVALPLIALATLGFATLGLLVGLVDRAAARRLARTWARTALALGGVRVERQGQAVPGPAVYAVNHVSVLDIPILFAHLPADFRIVHKRSLNWLPVVGWYLALAGHLAIDRANPFRARKSLARAAERIHDGVSVAVFPEGTRRGTQGLGAFKRGTFVLAINAAVPVVPVALVGLERLVPRGLLSLRPGTAQLKLHAPVPSAGRGPDQAEALAAEVRAIVARSLTLILLLAALAPVSLAAPPARPAASSLATRLGAALNTRELRAAYVGAEVRRLDGRVLFEKNAERAFAPASVIKLLTTAAALDAFGPGARALTTLETTGALGRQGRLHGDLYLVGRGDANLSGRFHEGRMLLPFERLADQLAATGVRAVEGQLIGHEGLFSGERRGPDWSWDDLVWWYGAEVSALSFNDNCVDLQVTPGAQAGQPLRVEALPQSGYYRVESSAVTGPAGSEDELRLERASGSNRIRLTGSLPAGSAPRTLNVALEDPARYAATVFAELLRSRGIAVAGGVSTSGAPLPAGLRTLARHEGPALRDALAAVNKRSQNLHAEMLLRLLGARAAGTGSVEAGLQALNDFLRRAGLEGAGSELRDGSGLSAHDLVTPRLLVGLLAHMDRHPHVADFKASLPVAGVDGTLRNRLKGTRAEGQVLAKTGSIAHVAALAGYATTRRGERVAFAALVNHQAGPGAVATAALDAFVRALVE